MIERRFGFVSHARTTGFTLIEFLLSLAIGGLILGALGGVVGQALETRQSMERANELAVMGQFAMQRMVRAVGATNRLMVPMADRAASAWPENIREETVPPSAPPPGSTLASAVLAVALPHHADLDGDGVPDADNDRDGRIDEDLPNDIHLDYASGIIGIDDDGDGSTDEAHTYNDDEYGGFNNEDPVDLVDDDFDGSVDEDPPSDMNGDACPGRCRVDDDGDGTIDEGAIDDDDEDGFSDEDWVDPVVFHLAGDTLQERTPVPWDVTGDSIVDGRDYLVSAIAENVSRFRVARVAPAINGRVLVELTLELTDPVTGQSFNLDARVQLGGAL